MKSIAGSFILLYLVSCLQAQTLRPYGPQPLAHTYSIVAVDPKTGQMGAAVQSHWFSVGSLVIWGEAGVGVVATQSFVNPAFGPDGLALMKAGKGPEAALKELLAADPGAAFRQVAFAGKSGQTAVHTGASCIAAAGHQQGNGYSVQANMMLDSVVWSAMADAYERAANRPFAERLLAALEAAQESGGDIRGQQSAAILIVAPESSGQVWADRLVDLRVEDHPQPVTELGRLLKLQRAYDHMNMGDAAVEKGDIDGAMRAYGAAEQLFPENTEMKYWHAIALANAGRLEEALPIFAAVFAVDNNWRELTRRLPASGLLELDADLLKQLLELDRD